MDLSVVLARRLKAARALSGKKVRELANELGWSDEKLYRFERGQSIPDALDLAAIASATGQSMEFLFLGITSAEPQEQGTLPERGRRVKDRAA